MYGEVRILGGSTLTTIAALVMSVSAATAQSNAWTPSQSPADGSGAGASREAAAPRALVSAGCGAPGGSVIRTENTALQTNSTAFVTVPGATTTVTVPAGTTRCIKVVFTGEAGCAGSSSADFCYIRALDNSVEMNPATSFRAFASEDSTAEAHAYEWVRRVGGGNHTIRIQGRVERSATTFFLDDWTFDVQVLQ